MSTQILDGVGLGFKAKVDNTNRVITRAVTNEALEEAVLNGDSYTLTSEDITLTSDNPSAVFYYKNQEDSTVILTRTIFLAQGSTGGSGTTYTFNTHINATSMSGGTGNDVRVLKLNLGSAKELTVSDSEKGAEGASFVGGELWPGFPFPLSATAAVATFAAIPRGSSIGHVITPPTGNTSLTLSTNINVYVVKNL